MNEQSQVVQSIFSALDDPRWEWRTVAGISSDTGLSPEEVRRVLNEQRDQILKSEVPSTKGEDLFTTVARWDRRASIASKILGSLRNRRR